MDRANYALAGYLAREREVHLVAHRVWPDLAQNPRITAHIVPRPLGSHLLGHCTLAAAGKRIASIFRDRGARVLVNGANCAFDDVNWLHIVHNAYRAPAYGSLLRCARIAAVHRIDCIEERSRVPRARLVVCNSRKTAREATRMLQLTDGIAQVVYLGVDPLQFGLPASGERESARAALGLEDRPHALFIGQLGNSIKNFGTLIAALCLLKNDPSWDVVLLVAGDSVGTHWPRQVAAAGLGDRVKFLGYRRDIPNLIAAADVVILPSRYDAYGLAAHEAICRGVPVIVSANTGIAERFPADLQELILNDADNAAQLAGLLRMWRGTIDAWPSRFRSLSDAFRAWTWDDMSAHIVRLATEMN
jgi:glycosyltransferase involved in cell wall biosynthesis